MNSRRFKLYFAILIICATTGILTTPLGHASSTTDYEDLKKEYSKSIQMLEHLNSLVQKKCQSVSGSDEGYKQLQEGFGNLVTCVSKDFHPEIMRLEIQIAAMQGETDMVIDKYCSKRPIVVECVREFHNKLDYCLTTEERQQKFIVKYAETVLDFICNERHNLMALVQDEIAIECLSEINNVTLTECLKTEYKESKESESNEIDDDSVEFSDVKTIFDIKKLPKLVIKKKECNKVPFAKTCLIREFTNCKSELPAKVFGSLLDYIEAGLCSQFKDQPKVI